MAYDVGAKPSKAPYKGFQLSEARARRLHRQLMCGNGFHEWLAKGDQFGDNDSVVSDDEDEEDNEDKALAKAMAASSLEGTRLELAHVPLDKLPTINYFEAVDPRYIDALLAEALPQDRERFHRYMSDRPLGLGIVTGVSSFTNAAAIGSFTDMS